MPECRKRLDGFAAHSGARYRALYMQRTAASRAGGTDRAADLAAALKALNDTSPLVRYYAAYGLGLIFSNSSATPYRKGLATARAALENRLAGETDARVKKKIAKSLKSMWP